MLAPQFVQAAGCREEKEKKKTVSHHPATLDKGLAKTRNPDRAGRSKATEPTQRPIGPE